jgi:hypothetical protein
MPGVVKRYFIVVGAILAVLVGGAFATKPKPGELKREVEEAMAAYAKAKAVAPIALKELSLPAQMEEHDWILARSYTAKQGDGATFSCWGVSVVTICNSPD